MILSSDTVTVGFGPFAESFRDGGATAAQGSVFGRNAGQTSVSEGVSGTYLRGRQLLSYFLFACDTYVRRAVHVLIACRWEFDF